MDLVTIYFLTTASDGYVPRYVGRSYKPIARLDQHVKTALCNDEKRKSKVHRWIQSRLSAGHEVLMFRLEKDVPASIEAFWIDAFRRRGYDLLNLTDGGECDGGRRAPETLEKQSRSMKEMIARRGGHWSVGRVHSDEEVKARAEKQRGRPRSEDTKRKISLANRGRKLSLEHIAQINDPANVAKRTAGRIASEKQHRWMKRYWEAVKEGNRLRDKSNTANGERVGTHKLTEKEVRLMRLKRSHGIELKVLAKEFSVSVTTVWLIVKRKAWKECL